MTPSPRATLLMSSLAMTLEHVKELEKTQPAEVDQIYAMLIAHVRSARPILLTSGVL